MTKVLLGDPLPPLPPLFPSEEALKTVWEVGMAQSQYWECMSPKIPAPRKGRIYLLAPCHRTDDWRLEKSSGQLSPWMVCFAKIFFLFHEFTAFHPRNLECSSGANAFHRAQHNSNPSSSSRTSHRRKTCSVVRRDTLTASPFPFKFYRITPNPTHFIMFVHEP